MAILGIDLSKNSVEKGGIWLLKGGVFATMYGLGGFLIRPVGPMTGLLFGSTIYLVQSIVDPIFDSLENSIGSWIPYKLFWQAARIVTWCVIGTAIIASAFSLHGGYLLVALAVSEIIKTLIVSLGYAIADYCSPGSTTQ